MPAFQTTVNVVDIVQDDSMRSEFDPRRAQIFASLTSHLKFHPAFLSVKRTLKCSYKIIKLIFNEKSDSGNCFNAGSVEHFDPLSRDIICV